MGPSVPSEVSSRQIIARFGHLAIWAGLYIGGAIVVLHERSGARHTLVEFGAGFFLGVSVYLTDRAKWLDAHLDPGDLASDERRHVFLRRHAPIIRPAMLVGAGTSAIMLACIDWRLVVLVPGSICGVIAYAWRSRTSTRRRARVKDVLLLKNLAVATSITMLAGAIVLASEGSLAPSPVLTLLLIVLGDAILCDLDDREADLAYGTNTLPTTFGPVVTWIVALALHVGACTMLPWTWGAILIATDLALMALPHRRDAVDARLGLAGLVLVLLP